MWLWELDGDGWSRSGVNHGDPIVIIPAIVLCWLGPIHTIHSHHCLSRLSTLRSWADGGSQGSDSYSPGFLRQWEHGAGVLVATHGSIRHILRVTADFCDVRKDWRFYLEFGDRVNFWTELMTLARDGGCFLEVYDYYLAGRGNDVLRAMDTNNKHWCRS